MWMTNGKSADAADLPVFLLLCDSLEKWMWLSVVSQTKGGGEYFRKKKPCNKKYMKTTWTITDIITDTGMLIIHFFRIIFNKIW